MSEDINHSTPDERAPSKCPTSAACTEHPAAPSAALTPRGMERVRALLESAIDIFSELGYERTSIRLIIERAGGSRSLIYQCFENKQGLFLACLQMMADDIYESYVKQRGVGLSLHDELLGFGTVYLKSMTSRRGLGMLRLIVAETPVFPEVGQWYWREAELKGCSCFAKVLEDCIDADEALRLETARVYFNLLKGGLVSECLAFPGAPAPTNERIREEVEAAARWVEAALAARGVHAASV